MDEALRARYGSAEGAAAYARKYRVSRLRRWSSRREMALVGALLARAGVEGGDVLDVPCAAGRLVPALLERADTVTAVDASPAMVEVAREALAAETAAGRARVVEGRAEALDFPAGSFDAAVCWRLLHHLLAREARVAVLRELRRVARRAVVVSFADAGSVKARLQRLRGRNRRCAKISAADLAGEAAEAGLEWVTARRLSSLFSLQAGALLVPR